MQASLKRKWRPRLWTVVLLVLGIVLCLPFAGLILFRFYDSQLVQQTEESLLTQAAVMSAAYAELYAAASGTEPPSWGPVSAKHAVFPSLSVNSETVLPPRPDAKPMTARPAAAYQAIAPQLGRIAKAAQAQTLAGYRLTDAIGNVFAGTAETGKSLGHVAEVQKALAGKSVSVARTRLREDSPPALYTLSRGARVRVFVAMPVFVDQTLIGTVYLSRTPNHIFRFLYGERFNLAKTAAFVGLSTALIGYVFWRFITRPIRLLIQRSQSAGHGDKAWKPPDQLGTREIEDLSLSFQSLTERLQSKQDALKTYTAHVTHELKSPLTALKGATELLRDDALAPSQRHRLLDTVDKGGKRMEDLLANMRAFSLADQSAMTGTCFLNEIRAQISQAFPALAIQLENVSLPLPVEARTLQIMLTHMLENSQQHGAQEAVLTVYQDGAATCLRIADDGPGISTGNTGKILQPFFTTKRDVGGTGMGLNIVKATMEAIGGGLSVVPANAGACFLLTFR
ncbi:HAMP domain-containing histidine kinase [Phaeobacter sp. HS012]|uniref:sensor histidine kinase n=1 Tax=unclassified Phaeobacter TaxID=2621772 RepID=UPI001B386832|nr:MULTISPECIES: HAMP domain-containing sensor histidine kinase [unclassified Phaeobacter]MBQ4808897.1 HAMP domain-containing histidine kinase [Phaeobacter sp. HS012]MBQ4883747.1 HAMP domain-containing histidine kinase [Phaeobacter sp. HS011]